MLDDHHLHKLQLCLILSFAQTALQRLIAFLSLKHLPNPDNCPDASFAKIVTDHNNDNPNNKVPNSEIKELDITAATKILRTIEVFLTSSDNRKSLTCSPQNKGPTRSRKYNKNNWKKVTTQPCCYQSSSCNYKCSGCNHKCTENNCGKDKCKDNKCCMLNFKQSCNHRCTNCYVLLKECKESITVCCEECTTCMQCIFKYWKLENCDKIYQEVINGKEDICLQLKLRLSVNIIYAFRNFLSHSTTPDYERMDKNMFCLLYTSPSPRDS